MKNKELLKKKISIGLSLEMSLDEYIFVFEKYKDYIKSIYFSPPLGEMYHSRKLIATQFEDPIIVEKFYEILKLARKYNIKLDCVLNKPRLEEKYVINSLDAIDKLDVDQITCLERHADILSKHFPEKKLIYSYNNDFKIKKLESIPKEFSTIVVGKYYLRNTELLNKIKSQGFDVKLLVNNGCSYNCEGCAKGTRKCINTFKSNLETKTPEELYALQSFYPNELNNLLNQMQFEPESIKISNRTDGYQYLDMCLDSYINEISPKEFISKNNKNYRLYCRLAPFNDYHKSMDETKILQYKKQGFKV